MLNKRMWLPRMSVAVLGLTMLLASCQLPAWANMAHPVNQQFTYPAIETTVFTDSSPDLLNGDPQGATIAQAAPTIDFAQVNIDPQKYGTEYGAWGNVVRGPDGNYYFGLGDHSSAVGGQDGALLCSYNPSTQKEEFLLFSKDVFGPQGEGKWHGRPDIDPRTGNMYLTGFYNGHVIQYNIYSREVNDLGAPVPGVGWPESTWDWQRGLLYGVGDANGSVLVYDTTNKKLIHQGQPVDAKTGQSFAWDTRSRMLDHETGYFYGTDTNYRLAKYDPASNTFTLLNSTLPTRLRAWTNQKDADGAFWIFDDQGDIFKFYPEQDKLIPEGKAWSGDRSYITFLERSPDDHYLYYSLADGGAAQGQPVLQYDTQTHTVKVLAFLSNYYASAHNYQMAKVDGGALSKDGSSLFLIGNGNIVNGPRMPSIFDVHIPDTERP